MRSECLLVFLLNEGTRCGEYVVEVLPANDELRAGADLAIWAAYHRPSAGTSPLDCITSISAILDVPRLVERGGRGAWGRCNGHFLVVKRE